MSQGRFITFEGCDGVGKSTQVRLLKEYLEESGQDALFLREPGGTKISEKIRALVLSSENSEMCDKTEVLLYCASRAQLIEEVIKPAVKKGTLVFCDRFIDSTTAYQGVARGLGFEQINMLNEFTVGEFEPDLTIFLDLDPTSAFNRKKGVQEGDRLEEAGLAFHKKVYDGYLRMADLAGERIVKIDASGEKAETFGKILKVLKGKGIIK